MRLNARHFVPPTVSGVSIYLVALSAVLSACDRPSDTTTPVRRDVVESVFATGTLELSDEYVVATSAEGFIDTVFVEVGDVVQEGDLLFRLTSPTTSSQLATAEAEYRDALRRADPHSPSIASLESQIRQARHQRDNERAAFERAKVLFETGAAPKIDYDAALLRLDAAESELDVLEQSLADLNDTLRLSVETAANRLKSIESQFDDTLIRAARSGRVLEVAKEAGELARKGANLGRIGAGDYFAELLVAEEDIARVVRGQDVIVELNTHPDHPVAAVVTRVHPSFDVVEQSFIVEASFAAESIALFDGTQLQAHIVVDRRRDALTIPAEFLRADDSVVLIDGRVVHVTPLGREGRWIEISADLDESDRIKIAR